MQCQNFGRAFRRPQLARELAKFTLASRRRAGRANSLVAIQTATKFYGLAQLFGRAGFGGDPNNPVGFYLHREGPNLGKTLRLSIPTNPFKLLHGCAGLTTKY